MPIDTLEEPHYPSKWTVALVFGVILLLIIGVFVWAFYLNLGTVIVRGDQVFTVEVNGDVHQCAEGTCEISLSPGLYDFTAHSEGYYEESFSLQVERWSEVDYPLRFVLVPFLQELEEADLPDEDKLPVRVNRTNGTIQFIREDAGIENIVTEFETLSDPQVRLGGNLALIVDKGRIFFVDLESGRKQRRFDDTVSVYDALVSDNGKRALLFLSMEGSDFIWLWFNETSELMPLQWYENPEFVQWERGVDHRIYVISDQLQERSDPSLFADLLQTVNLSEPELHLFQVNLDTDEVKTIHSFSSLEKPVRFMLRDGRYFVEYEEGNIEELFVR